MARDFKSKATSLLDMTKKVSGTIEDIPLDKLVEHEDNEYLFGMDGIEMLAHSIQINGFRGAIEVYKLENGKYEIASGHRRAKACELIDMREIPATVKPLYKTQAERNEWLLDSNLRQRGGYTGFSPIHVARMIDWYIEKVFNEQQAQKEIKDNKKKAVADKFDMSEGLLYKYQAINSYIPEIQEKIENGIAFSAFYGLQNKDVEFQKKLNQSLDRVIDEEGLDAITVKKIKMLMQEIETPEVEESNHSEEINKMEDIIQELLEQSMSDDTREELNEEANNKPKEDTGNKRAARTPQHDRIKSLEKAVYKMEEILTGDLAYDKKEKENVIKLLKDLVKIVDGKISQLQ